MARRPHVSVPPPSLAGDKVQQQQALESLLREIEQRVQQLECNVGSYFVQHSYSTVTSHHDVLNFFVFRLPLSFVLTTDNRSHDTERQASTSCSTLNTY